MCRESLSFPKPSSVVLKWPQGMALTSPHGLLLMSGCLWWDEDGSLHCGGYLKELLFTPLTALYNTYLMLRGGRQKLIITNAYFMRVIIKL